MKKVDVKKEQILNKIPVFLAKTYRIVDNPEYDDTISWAEDGDAFVIKDIAELTNQIFPRHFKHSNYLSFVRQLNFYGFRKKPDQLAQHTFSHPFFRRDNLELLLEMKRKHAQSQDSNQNALVVAGSREERLQKELQNLKSQHQQLQGMMEVLVEQNKSITAQNKVFAKMMSQMKDKYRKKLQTLMLLFLFGKKPQGDSDFLFPAHFEQMVQAFEQVKNGNPMLMAPSKRPKRSPKLKMITNSEPRFQEDIIESDHPEQEESKMSLQMQRVPSERSGVEPNGLELSPAPLSPFSVVSRGNMRRLEEEPWQNYLNRIHSECSEFELEQQHD